MQHQPVLKEEIERLFREHPHPKRYFDGTLGRGGHLESVLEIFPQLEALAFDKDQEAIAAVGERLRSWIEAGRLQLKNRDFADFDPEEEGSFDLMLLDLGVSSPQLDVPARGFSFLSEGPLDMRMDLGQSLRAADIVNLWSEDELYQIFRDYGEIRRPGRLIRALVHDRKERPFNSTRDLAGLIERVEGWRKKGHHPATRYFQALRIAVNDELRGLEQALPKLMTSLRPRGRLCVLTFHSLEDRIVKRMFRSSSEGRPVNKKVIVASPEEEKANPRARSAKLRCFERKDFTDEE